jgi:hypothetical protein
MESTTTLDLSQFIGTANYYQTNPMFAKGLHHTDGVQYFADNAGNGAQWFLDIVATEIFPMLKKEPFMAIKLVANNGTAVITAEDGDCKEIFSKDISYTDCPDGDYQFFLTDNVLMLSSEY